jgi:hypothetical protein
MASGKLTQINPSDGKSKRNQTKSGHFFHQTDLKLIHWHANPLIRQPVNSWSSAELRLFKPFQAISRLFKAIQGKKIKKIILGVFGQNNRIGKWF